MGRRARRTERIRTRCLRIFEPISFREGIAGVSVFLFSSLVVRSWEFDVLEERQ